VSEQACRALNDVVHRDMELVADADVEQRMGGRAHGDSPPAVAPAPELGLHKAVSAKAVGPLLCYSSARSTV
jgi:hypothetical protein